MNNIPRHVALIMDGNRRWARFQKLPELEGHRRGEANIEPLVDYALDIGISYLTFWAFSTENWQRSKKEVTYLLRLYRHNLDKKVSSFHKKNVKVNVLGNLDMFPPDLVRKTRGWMQKTKNNNRITVNLALSYGGRDEIIRAVNKWHRQNINSSKKLQKEEFSRFLDTAGQPDPDLLIRTGGEKRLSGFLLWQIEYTELYFTDCLWPDFTPSEFTKALSFYAQRKRRFGK